MTILSFVVQLMSGAMLLLFAVRFLRIGVERLWSAQIRLSLNAETSLVRNLAKGAGLGFVMQGATVVVLMTAGLAGSGTIPVVSAAIVSLGADLGSALAVQFLQLPISALGPLLLVAGASLYLRAKLPRLRNYGRVLLGLGLIFLSLSLIRTAVAPLGTAPGTADIVAYLNRDLITAALAGVVLTLVMHSSVAAILTAIAFAHHTALDPAAGLAFVLGANLGSSLVPVWLLKFENGRSRSVAAAVAGVRIAGSVALILAVVFAGAALAAVLPLNVVELMLAGHFGFNLLLMAFAPVCLWLAKMLDKRWAADEVVPNTDLSAEVLEDSSLALPALKRQVSGMLDAASAMLEEVSSSNPDKDQVLALKLRIAAALGSLRLSYARLPSGDDKILRDVQQIVEFAIRIERSSDALAGEYLDLRLGELNGEYTLSDEGKAEVSALVAAVHNAIVLAQETSWTGDIGTAQRLVRHKQDVADMESRSRLRHLARLRRGNLLSVGSSDQHLELIATLKEINSKFATIGYAVLQQHGGLKKSRLKASAKASA